jgi:class 3 adenylate cyclase
MTLRRFVRDHGDTFLRVLGWAIALAVTGGVFAALGSWATRGFPPQPAGWAQSAMGISAVALIGVIYALVAAALINRLPRHPIGWIFLGISFAMAIVIPINQALEGVLHSMRAVPQPMLLVGWAVGAVQLPGAVVSAILVLLLFPSGRPEYRYWRLAAALALSGFLLLTVSTALRPEGLLWYPTLPNPLATPSTIRPLVAAGMLLGATALVSSLVLAALWLAGRFRFAHSVERRHLAWVAFGAITMTVTVTLLFVARYVGPVDDPVGERLMLLAAIGAVIFPVTLFRFVTATASEGVEMDDLTFLFTDLQDSTLMYERVGDATAYDLVRVHFRVLESVTREHGGVIVKTIGDAIMARFFEPTQAVHTAIHMQERIDALARDGRTDLVLRIGIHRGPAIAVVNRDRVDYFGQTVNTASRIQAAAAPGEIVLSDDVYRGIGVADLLVGYPVVAQRQQLRGVTREMLLHRINRGRRAEPALPERPGLAASPRELA